MEATCLKKRLRPQHRKAGIAAPSDRAGWPHHGGTLSAFKAKTQLKKLAFYRKRNNSQNKYLQARRPPREGRQQRSVFGTPPSLFFREKGDVRSSSCLTHKRHHLIQARPRSNSSRDTPPPSLPQKHALRLVGTPPTMTTTKSACTARVPSFDTPVGTGEPHRDSSINQTAHCRTFKKCVSAAI